MPQVGGQHTADKRKCAACCTCGQQFSHGEARLQQWSNRHPQRAYVHAQCVNGSVAHDQELHPKQPTDPDAVEAVARQRDCVTHAAADSDMSQRARIKPPQHHLQMMSERVWS